jgi:hypothetical protein
MGSVVRLASFVSLAVGEAGDALPSEFRLFKIGANPTTKGTFTLTVESAAAAMATYAAQGVDVMVDLNHDSLSDEVRAQRSDAGDARGWFKLELRADGLWAVDVRWTPDGEERLRSKKQRYISPAFLTDDSGVIFEIVNAALVAMPATHNAPALVAASALPSANDTRNAVEAALRLKFPAAPVSPGVPSGPDLWVCDMYLDRVVFERAGKLYQIAFTYVPPAAVAFTGAPVEVVRTYTPVGAARASKRAAGYVALVRAESQRARMALARK